MKKILIATLVLSVALTAKVYAAGTYTETLLDTVHQKINDKAAPVVNKEKKLQEKQKAAQELKLKEVAAKKKFIEDKQKAQQELVEKKKQQIKDQKELFKKQKEEIKGLFSIE